MKSKFWENKKIVITGGTSGLGKALALKLSQLGARVVIVARDPEKIKTLQTGNSNIFAIRGDVADKESIYPIVGQAFMHLGEIDVLINNASYLGMTPLRILADTECEDFAKVLETNLLAPFRLTKAVLGGMIAKKHGIIMNISSDAAVSAYPTWGSYSISKAGLDHMTRIFAEELKDQGVKFLAVDPGDMNTPMHFAAIPNANPAQLRSPEESAEKLIAIMELNTKEVRNRA